MPFTLDGSAGEGVPGRYRVESEIGLVATGALFAARDETAARPVAIQLFHPAFFAGARHATQRERLVRALRYEHAHVAPTHAVGEAFGTVFVATAPIIGQPLTHWRRDVGRIGVADVYRLVGQLIEGVAAIHAEGGVHGSLSPDTLRVVQDQAWIVNPWTLDVPPDVPPGQLPPPRASWLAPELLFPDALQGAETDVYGLGLAMGYLLACGLTEPGHSLLVQGIDVPPAVDDVYVRATARQREARYRDLAALTAALEAAAGFEWRDAQNILPRDGAVRSLGVEVLESLPVAPPFPREAGRVETPPILESRSPFDVESTSEDEAIPAFSELQVQVASERETARIAARANEVTPVPGPLPTALPDAVVVEAPRVEVLPQPEILAESPEGHGGYNDAVTGVPRAGRRKLARTLVGGSPRTGPTERPSSDLAPLPDEIAALAPSLPEPVPPPRKTGPPVPRPVPGPMPPVDAPPSLPGSESPPPMPSSASQLPPMALGGSLESLDGGAVMAGGPPPLPPSSTPFAADPTAPPALPVASDASSAHAPVELHEPTIVEPFAPSLLEYDVFGVAAHSQKKQPDPFVEPPPPMPSEWGNDSPFVVSASESEPPDIFASATPAGPMTAGDRPFTEPTFSAGSLAMRRPDAPITRSKVERPPPPMPMPMGSMRNSGSVVAPLPTVAPAGRKRRFPWAVALAVLAGVIVAVVLFSVLSSSKPGPGGELAATGPGPVPPGTGTVATATALPSAADATASDTVVAAIAGEDAAVAEAAAEVADDTADDVSAPDGADVQADEGADAVDPDGLLLAATAPSEDAVSESADAAAADTAIADTVIADTSVADTAIADTSVADTAIADTAVATAEADTAVADTADAALPSDYTPKDPAKLSCPGGMAKLKKKIQVTLADGKKVDDWEVVCIDLYEFPGAGAPPRTNVDISGARGACIGKGKRLCTRSEWRRACGGTYPYGSAYDAEKCASAREDGSPGSVVAAGSKKGCRSPSGAYDMVGNVAEWTSDGTVNGGSAFKNGADGTCNTGSRRAGGAPYVGFRCCTDAK